MHAMRLLRSGQVKGPQQGLRPHGLLNLLDSEVWGAVTHAGGSRCHLTSSKQKFSGSKLTCL